MALIWEETFQNLSKWRVHTGENWGNGSEDQRYTTRLENVRLTDEGLVIEARREQLPGSTRKFTSARIDSRGTLVLLRGYIEVPARIEVTEGSFPAIWTLGGEQNYKRGWPGGGEIDVVECAGGRSEVRHNVHAGDPHWQHGWGKPGARQAIPDMATAFHAYGVFFDETVVRFYIDREETMRVQRGSLPPRDWPFGTEPQWVLLNYALGSVGGEPLNGTWPRQMTVRPVRAYTAIPTITPPEEPPPPLAKPGAPTGLRAVPGDGRVTLSWDARPASEVVDIYQVYVNGENTPPSDLAVPGTTYVLTAPNGIPVSLRVGAHNAAGYGPWSAPVVVIPAAVEPPPPPPPPPLDLAGIRADLLSASSAVEAAIRKLAGA